MLRPSLMVLTSAAFNDTTSRLLRPLRWGVWWKLWLIAWLSGYLGGGLNFNFHIPSRRPVPQEHAALQAPSPEPAQQDTTSKKQEGKKEQPQRPPTTYQDLRHSLGAIRRLISQHPGWVAVAVLAMVPFMLLFNWLGARFSFVFVDVMTTGRVAIVEPFGRYRELGRSLFWWMTWLGVVILGALGALVWTFMTQLLARYAQTPERPLELFLFDQWQWVGQELLITIFLFGLPLIVLGTWTTDFVVPIMWRRRSGILNAWQEQLRLVQRHPWDQLKYLMWKLLLEVVIGLTYMIALLAAILALVIAAVVLVLVGVVMMKLLPVTKVPLQVLGAVLLIVTILALAVAFVLCAVFPAVWLRIFSLRFLQAVNPEYQFFQAT